MRNDRLPIALLTCIVSACSSDSSSSSEGATATGATGGMLYASGGSGPLDAASSTGGTYWQGGTSGMLSGGTTSGGSLNGGTSSGGTPIGGASSGGSSTGGGVMGGGTGGISMGGGSGGASGTAASGGSPGGAPPGTGGDGGATRGGGTVGTGASSGDAGASGVAGIGGSAAAAGTAGDGGQGSQTLRGRYADYFPIGAAIDTSYNDYAELLREHFNSVTAENEMKFDALQPSEGNFTYSTADQMVALAQQNGMLVRGHALVWHRQTPDWVFSNGFGGDASRDQVLQRMRNHIDNVMQHFQGKVYAWDVVNEAIMDTGEYRTGNEAEGQQSRWYEIIGESYIAEAFRYARQADPTAKLFYNDYYNYHPVRRQAIHDMLAGLLADAVPVDGVGLQCHLNLEPGNDPTEQSYYQTVANLEEAINLYSSLGLEVQITELDVSLYLRGIEYTPDMFYTLETFTPAVQAQQAERFREFFDMFREHRDVITGLTLWGIADDNTWLSEFSSGRQDFPLLFDVYHQPKPAFDAVMDF
jgi:endo-1,4-beta-xylanase